MLKFEVTFTKHIRVTLTVPAIDEDTAIDKAYAKLDKFLPHKLDEIATSYDEECWELEDCCEELLEKD